MNVPTDFGPDSGGRVKGVSIIKPIVYGNKSLSFLKKRDEDGHTHQWTVYVKPFFNEEMSAYVKKIHFKLHESYYNPNRIVTRPPFEVTETGWGEFEVVIKIYFHDPTERPVTLYHILKLFQSPTTSYDVKNITPENENGLISEFYEEIVFQEPTQLMQHYLTNIPVAALTIHAHSTDFSGKNVQTLDTILKAKMKVKMEITLLKNKLKMARESIVNFKNDLSKTTKI